MIYENDKNSMIHYKIGKWLMTSGKWNCFTCLGKFYQVGIAGAKKYKKVCSKHSWREKTRLWSLSMQQ